MAVLEQGSGANTSVRTALWGSLLAAPLLFCACASAPGLAQSEVQLEYTLRIEDPSQQRVELTALLTHLDGPLVVGLPEAFAFVRLDEPRLTDGPRASDGARLEPLDAFTWRLDPGPARAVQLSWSVALDHRDLPQVREAFDDYEFPFLESDHGLFVTGALLIGPTEREPRSIHVRFELPAGWPVHAPWPEPEPGRFAPPSARAARDDLVAVGHWRVWREEIQGLTLTVAFAPGQEALEAPVLERIGPIVAAELELFGCLPQSNYLFLFGPSELGGCGGSTKTSSMTLFVSPDLPPQWALERLEHLIAHEYYHTWEWADGHLPDELRFVNEGFTDYYAHLMPWRLGLQGDAHLLRRLEEELAAYEEAQADCGLSLLEAGGPEFFEGGEPFLYYPLLLEGVRRVSEQGLRVGIVSNGYWATSERDAALWLDPLRGRVQDLSLSSDSYHGSEGHDPRAENARRAAAELGIGMGVISIAEPEAAGARGAVGHLPPGQSAVMYRGRAAEKLADRADKAPWESFDACPHENFEDPGRLHVDPFGNTHACQGIAIGNLLDTPLAELCANWDPRAHPIVGPLMEGGPAALVRRYGLDHESEVADACQLCDRARRALRSEFPETLTPSAMYGVNGD